MSRPKTPLRIAEQPNGTPPDAEAAIARIRYASGLRQSLHRHPQASLTLVVSGMLEETVGNRTERARPLSVVVKPAGVAHATAFGSEEVGTLQLRVPPGYEVPGPWRWFHGGEPARLILRVLGSLSGGPRATEIETAIADCLGAFADSRATSPSAPPGWLRPVIEELEDTFAAPRPVRVLALEAGVHPVSLARAWRRAVGTSITEYLRRRRIQEAAGLLAGRTEALSAVAYQTGFSDQSHMTRIFRRETGMTPASFRAVVRPRNWRATKEV